MTNKWLASIFITTALLLTGCTDTENDELTNSEGTETAGNPDAQDSVSTNDEMPEPPELTVVAGDESIDAVLGTYSWSIDNEDGTMKAIEADSAPPPELVGQMAAPEVTGDTSIELDFKIEPDSYTVKIWQEDNTVISESEEVLLTSEGTVIYEVLANWQEGTASYAFTLYIE